MRIIELEGTRREIGLVMGTDHREEIRALYAARINNAIRQALFYGRRQVTESGLLSIAGRCLPIVRAYDEGSWDELCGIAEGAGLDVAQVWMMNALTDVRDLAAYGEPDWTRPIEEGCSAVVISGERAGGAPIAGQTWDLSTDNMPFVRLVIRRPVGEPATACLTLVGCLSLIGLNDRGVAVGTTNVRATDNRLGVGYLDVIHRSLHQRSSAEAIDVVRDAPRAGAHFYYVLGPEGAPRGLECTAHVVEETSVADHYVHTNHMLHPRTSELEARGTPTASSHARQDRLQALLTGRPEVGTADLKAFLADQEGGENAVDRRDFRGISTNGAVVLEPRGPTIHAVWGPASQGTWVTVRLERSH